MKLKQCPFCGGKAEIRQTTIKETGYVNISVGCKSMKCHVQPYAAYQNSEYDDVEWSSSTYLKIKRLTPTAIAQWNTRSKGK